jgi:hypothetical protein
MWLCHSVLGMVVFTDLRTFTNFSFSALMRLISLRLNAMFMDVGSYSVYGIGSAIIMLRNFFSAGLVESAV